MYGPTGIVWANLTPFSLQPAALLAGVAAGTLGIGGGVANQLGGAADTWPTKYTALGMRPDVSAAVAAAMALLAATTATLQYLVAGLIGWSATQALASYLAPSPGRGLAASCWRTHPAFALISVAGRTGRGCGRQS